MDIELFKHIDGIRLDVTCNELSIKDTIQLLLDELDIDGYITTCRYKTSTNPFIEYEHEPMSCGYGEVSIKVKLEFSCENFRDYFEVELMKRLNRIKTLELCFANSIDEV